MTSCLGLGEELNDFNCKVQQDYLGILLSQERYYHGLEDDPQELGCRILRLGYRFS